jgi:tetratricopeptide (TPR) repeat protein
MYDAMQASLNADDPEGLRKIVENTLAFLTGPGWLTNVRRARATVDGDTDLGKVKTIADWLVTGGTEQVVRALDRIEQLAAQGHYLSAMEEAFLALHFAPNYLSLHSRMADILLKTNRTEAAVEKLQVIAATHRVRGENRQAADVYARILEYSPVDLALRTHLIELLAQQDRVDEAVDQYLELVDLYRQMAEIDQARATLEQALNLTQRGTVSRQKQLGILHRMADIDLSRLDWRGALRVYAQVRKLDPNDEKARRESVDLNLRLGQEEQAARELDGYLEFLVQNGRGTEALALLEEMAREHPGKQALHARLAEAYRAAGRTADAIAQYDALGEIQLDAGSVREAARTIQIIISLNPPDVEGYKELLRNLEAGQ